MKISVPTLMSNVAKGAYTAVNHMSCDVGARMPDLLQMHAMVFPQPF